MAHFATRRVWLGLVIVWLAVCCLIYLLPYWALASWRGYLPEKLQLPALRDRGPVPAA